MSDGLSQIARDEEREEKHQIYMLKLFDYLFEETSSNYNLLKKAAQDVDSVRGGYWCPSRTKIESKLDETLKRFKIKDEKILDFYMEHAKNVSLENISEMIEKISKLKSNYPEFSETYLNCFK